MLHALYIVWSEKYETGITIIDEQQRGLVSLINTFFFHKSDADKDIYRILVPTVEMLKAYTRLYFLTLERLLRETGYSDLEGELRLHEEMLTTINSIDAKHRANRDADGILNFLKEYWLDRATAANSKAVMYLKNYYGV